MPNRLAHSTSPYLRQHAENPVDWYPWGEEALELARREDRPILLSIGYAACHWCHVMADESFEDPDTAAIMNELYVNVKVDREERPDLDSIYMGAVQAMTGHGGWPMTVVLTPDGAPFFGGTYFPPEDRHGLPAFRRVLRSVATAYRERREDVERSTAAVRGMYDRLLAPARSSGPLSMQLLEKAFGHLAARHDAARGGFGNAPKFPQPLSLDFALRYWRRTGDERALRIAHDSFLALARGGIHDQVGGGFHRYTVDAAWLVPHFEKMLYDNALLARLGTYLWQATGDVEVRRAVEDTLAWVRREMTAPNGGFHSSLDADSEGEEGRFYIWDASELDTLLDGDAQLLRAYWGVTDRGNFEGRNILHVPQAPAEVARRLGVSEERLREAVDRAEGVLYQAREQRVRPTRDDKVIAAWNAFMLRAVALAARVFHDDDLKTMALRNGELLLNEHVRDGRVLRVTGATPISGFLDDQAATALAFLDLYELTFDDRWRAAAEQLCDAMVEWFWDDDVGVFFDSASDAEQLITRPREVTDNAAPSGTSLAVELLVRMSELQHDADRRRRAVWVLETLAGAMEEHAMAFGHLLGAADLAINGAVEVALVGRPDDPDLGALATEVNRRYIPDLVLACGAPRDGGDVALLADRPARDGRATAYVCRGHVCDAPTSSAEELGAQLDGALSAG